MFKTKDINADKAQECIKKAKQLRKGATAFYMTNRFQWTQEKREAYDSMLANTIELLDEANRLLKD